MTTARVAAARVLLAVDRGNTTLASEMEEARADLTDSRDRALLLELASGVLRWRAALDAIIAMASGRSVRDIDSEALAVLRLAVYQLRHLDRIPAHAVLHESVDTVRTLHAPKAAGFVNAVLRSVQRRGATLKLPSRPPADGARDAQERYLSTTLSHPRWLVRRWLERYGFESTERWCAFNNSAPTITVRSIGRLSAEELAAALVAEGIGARRSDRLPEAVRLAAGELGRIPASLRAQLRIQDEGAQLVAQVTAARPGERMADLCAAPGGKTLIAAHDLGLARSDDDSGAAVPQSQVVAADFRPGRVTVLAEAVRASGLPIGLVRLDARRPLPFRDVFDVVLLDVPCSGLGTLRRDPDIKWRRQPADLPILAGEALGMLRQASAIVRPGGRLVYATCSSEPDENEDVVRQFLAGTSSFTGAAPALITTPFTDGLDAFFAAVLVRQPAP